MISVDIRMIILHKNVIKVNKTYFEICYTFMNI